MSRAHRVIVSVAAVSWTVALGLMFTPLMGSEAGDPVMAAFLRVASINAGALAACFTTVSVLPYLLRDFYKANVTDYVGAFLAGWAKSQEVEPDEPVRLHVVGD